MKCVFKQQDLQMLGIKLNMSNFQPLEVVDGGSETQLQVRIILIFELSVLMVK